VCLRVTAPRVSLVRRATEEHSGAVSETRRFLPGATTMEQFLRRAGYESETLG
jgi:hypothetical protein